MQGAMAIWLRRRTWAVPVLLLLAVTLPHLEQGDIGTDSGRYAAVGLQAWRDPACFWTLHLHPDVVYFNKPPLALWIHGLVLHLFGVGFTAMRLPSVLAAAGCVGLSVVMARRLLGRTAALAAGMVLALSYEFFRRAHEVSLDLWQLLFMLASLAAVVRAERRQAWGWVVAAGIPLGLALMCKPFMALLVLPIAGAWLIPAHGRRVLPCLAGMSLTALAVALPWHVAMWMAHGSAFVQRYVGIEVIGKLQSKSDPQPFWYYAVEIGRTYWPWMIPLGFGLLAWGRGQTAAHRRAGLRLAGLWLAIWLLALTLFPDKRPRYELPLYPLAAWIAGYGLIRVPWRALRRVYQRGLPRVAAVALGGAVIVACLPIRFLPPDNPERAAVLEWLRERGVETAFAAALSTNDEGYFYLKRGKWLRPVRTARGTLRPHLEPEAILIYTQGLEPRPGADETELFRSGPYTVTRLQTDRWRPVIPGP